MARSRTLVLVLAGGAGSRLDPLTRHRAKPAVPFGGSHRLIDFPLSNARNAGVDDVWVAQQHDPASLTDHLANGRPWDLDRTDGGLRIVHPALGDDVREGFHDGTADALWRTAPRLREADPDVLVVVSADAVYALDYEELAEEHRRSAAEATMVTTRVDPADAGRYGVVVADEGRVVEYAYKPDEPRTDLVAIEVFAVSTRAVLGTLEQIADESDPDSEDGLGDLGDDLLPRLVEAGVVREHRFDGYWRDVGTIGAYWQAHQDLLADPPSIDLDDPAWPIASDVPHARSAALVDAGAEVGHSLLGAGAHVAGTVRDSVVGPGSVVGAGAVVTASVLLPGARVAAGARIGRSIVDGDEVLPVDEDDRAGG